MIASTLKSGGVPCAKALPSLEPEGPVSRATNRGTTGINLSRRDVEEICSLRLPLKFLAVRRAIENGTAEHWARMEANVRETEQAALPTSSPRQTSKSTTR